MFKQFLNGEISLFNFISAITIGFIIVASSFNFVQNKIEERKTERISQDTRSVSVETTAGSSVSVHSRSPDSAAEQEIQDGDPRSVFITNENVESQVIVIY